MSISMMVLDDRYKHAEQQFNDLKANGLVAGDFEGKVWQYRSSNIPFTSLDPLNRRNQDQPPLPLVIGKLARCFIVKETLKKTSRFWQNTRIPPAEFPHEADDLR